VVFSTDSFDASARQPASETVTPATVRASEITADQR
jgi:hypothetical protein